MASRNVTRSSGETVELKLNAELSDFHFRDCVVIDIPKAPYNSQFTFVRKQTSKGPWVQLVRREKIDPSFDATLHVSQTVFHGMASWACAILHAKRLMDERGKSFELNPSAISWDVFWRTTDEDVKVADAIVAESSAQATRRGWWQRFGGFPSLTLDLMYALPHCGNKYLLVKPDDPAMDSPGTMPSANAPTTPPTNPPAQLRFGT